MPPGPPAPRKQVRANVLRILYLLAGAGQAKISLYSNDSKEGASVMMPQRTAITRPSLEVAQALGKTKSCS